MHRLVLLLMIVLLPLRGWAGDFIAIGMAAGQTTSEAAASMPADCPMHAQASDTANPSTPDEVPSTQGCCSCDLCLPLAEVGPVALPLLVHARHAEPPFVELPFLSALPAPALEPPIS